MKKKPKERVDTFFFFLEEFSQNYLFYYLHIFFLFCFLFYSLSKRKRKRDENFTTCRWNKLRNDIVNRGGWVKNGRSYHQLCRGCKELLWTRLDKIWRMFDINVNENPYTYLKVIWGGDQELNRLKCASIPTKVTITNDRFW